MVMFVGNSPNNHQRASENLAFALRCCVQVQRGICTHGGDISLSRRGEDTNACLEQMHAKRRCYSSCRKVVHRIQMRPLIVSFAMYCFVFGNLKTVHQPPNRLNVHPIHLNVYCNPHMSSIQRGNTQQNEICKRLQ